MSRDKEEIERDLAENDGLRPDEDEGPGESVASPKRCEFKQGERTGGVGDSSFEVMDELHESFPTEPIPTYLDDQGMPAFVEPDPSDSQAIPFTWETQLCIEDDRQYVELFQDEVEVSPFVNPWYKQLRMREHYDKDGKDVSREKYSPDKVERRWGMNLVRIGDKWRPVRPLRERCKHYKRQVFSNDSQPDPAAEGHQIVFRVCAARRSNGGAYMSVCGEGVYACDFRDPPDNFSTSLQDKKDRKKLVERPDLLKLPMFGIEGESMQLENKV